MAPAASAQSSAGRIAELSPSSFAIVMATGILGGAAQQQGYEAMSRVLLAITMAAWALLAVMSAARFVLHRDRMLMDLRSHDRAPGFLTSVAGTAVMGSLWLLLGLRADVAALIGVLSAALWAALTYGMLAALTVQPEKPPLAAGIGGSWLLLVVGTQSLAVIATLLASTAPHSARLPLDFIALSLWLCAGMLYVWVISLIFYRWVFFRLAPDDLAPAYWINMGAMAISALAGALLVDGAAQSPFLAGLLPMLKGGTLLFWAVGSWWIPLLAALALWRYVFHRSPLRYEVGYWSAVFPLAMYSAATHRIALALDLEFLAPVARVFFYVAAAAWLATAAGLLRSWRALR